MDEGLELLTEDQARGLLATGEVGRIGITIGALPAIFPVNYRLVDGSIVFRTAPGSKMSAAADGAVIAFEVDDYQLADRTRLERARRRPGRADPRCRHDLQGARPWARAAGRWEADGDRADRADVSLEYAWRAPDPEPDEGSA